MNNYRLNAEHVAHQCLNNNQQTYIEMLQATTPEQGYQTAKRGFETNQQQKQKFTLPDSFSIHQATTSTSSAAKEIIQNNNVQPGHLLLIGNNKDSENNIQVKITEGSSLKKDILNLFKPPYL